MIATVAYASPAPSQVVAITMQNGAIWTTDASLPADTEVRRTLAAWVASGGVIAPYVAPPAPVPSSITRGQCAREMFERDMISGLEMVNMTTVGSPPAFVAEYFDLLPERDRMIAYADFARDNYVRSNSLLNDTLTALGSNAAGIDDFFREAAQR